MKRIFAAGLGFLLSYSVPNFLSASWDPHQFKNLTVTADFKDPAYKEANGTPVYERLQRVWYRVIIRNNGHRSFKNLPVKMTLIWDRDTVCNRYWSDNWRVQFYALENLPGNAVSGPHLLNIGSGSYSFIDGFYDIPDTVCPNAVRIKLDAGRDSRYDSLLTGYSFVIR